VLQQTQKPLIVFLSGVAFPKGPQVHFGAARKRRDGRQVFSAARLTADFSRSIPSHANGRSYMVGEIYEKTKLCTAEASPDDDFLDVDDGTAHNAKKVATEMTAQDEFFAPAATGSVPSTLSLAVSHRVFIVAATKTAKPAEVTQSAKQLIKEKKTKIAAAAADAETQAKKAKNAATAKKQ
jgi:hypothetical protein